jgi:hypothetical protein
MSSARGLVSRGRVRPCGERRQVCERRQVFPGGSGQAVSALRIVADAAVHGPARGRLEGNHYLLLALPAGGRMLIGFRAAATFLALPTPLLTTTPAALGRLVKSLLREELLSRRGEYERLSTFLADQYLICPGSCM